MNIIDRTFEKIYGEICWDVIYERFLNLSMRLGEPSFGECHQPSQKVAPSEIRRRIATKDWQIRPFKARRWVHVQGRWGLWIYMAYWKISCQGIQVATSSSSPRIKSLATQDLDGQKLTKVQVNPDTGATAFSFDLGSVVEVRRFERTSTDELWILNKPNGYFLSVRGDGTYDHVPGSGLDNRPGVKRRPLE
ncbi:MAG: hypothetical protein ISS79_02270 [Phycisphaerae bacterium]|nr:hypothetical protein [Phycisphaerae bacterium]